MALDGISSASGRTKRPPYLRAKFVSTVPWCRRPGIETRGKYVRVRMTRLMALRSKTDVSNLNKGKSGRLIKVSLRLKGCRRAGRLVQAAESERPAPLPPQPARNCPGHQGSGLGLKADRPENGI
jgi:hypothetical protein